MKKYILIACTVLSVSILISCETLEEVNTPTGEVVTIEKKEVKDKTTGKVSIVAKRIKEIAERSVADKGAESLVQAQKVISVGSEFSYSIGKNDEIVASVYHKTGSDIWRFVGGKSRITDTSHFNSDPSYSSDSKYIYYSSKRGGNKSYIWRTPASGGGGITRIGSPLYSYIKPLESPDGTKLLYSAREYFENSPFIWYSKTNGSLPTLMKKGSDANWFDNNKIIFSAKDENTGLFSIWISNINGSELTQIIADNELDSIYPVVDRTKQYVAYVKQKPGNKASRDIYIYNIKEGLSQQLTTNISRDDIPQWSKNDNFLYFRSTRGIGWNIWRIKLSEKLQ